MGYRSASDDHSGVDARAQQKGSHTMVWTILIVLVIIALIVYIVSHMRGRSRL